MKATNRFTAFAGIILIAALLLIFLSFKTNPQNNVLIGTWEGEVNETVLTLVFKGNHTGSLTYHAFDKTSNFEYNDVLEYSEVNDSVISISRDNRKFNINYRIKDEKVLNFYTKNDSEKANDIIYELTFYKK